MRLADPAPDRSGESTMRRSPRPCAKIICQRELAWSRVDERGKLARSLAPCYATGMATTPKTISRDDLSALARALGSRGGKATAAKLGKAELAERARKGGHASAAIRWAGHVAKYPAAARKKRTEK